jgi:phosphoribosylformylglycinamidine synthase subunit PurQ / glutaminase
MSQIVKVIVIRTAGTNCNEETAFAFSRSGAHVEQVHINALMSGTKKLSDYHILALPGGFSYGDDIASGRILANELRLKLGEDIKQFIRDGKLIIGICNGFQILAKAGILPGLGWSSNRTLAGARNIGQEATLFYNDSAKFETRWVHLKMESRCVWTKGMSPQIYLPVAHGEGKFIPREKKVLDALVSNGQIVLRYCTSDGGKPAYPDNPNGSTEDIAGICDTTGRVLGLMPHPERHFLFEQHPYWTRLTKKSEFGDGAKIFENGINYVKENLLKSH